ncbi:MAG: hypothetical protein HYY17_16190 [Planctomycetes bacterium]|nr:hypothetical protein [Planctomycetota bacterium]
MRPPQDENRTKKDAGKKPYRRPTIKSGKFYERKALACPKVQAGAGECAPEAYS